MPTEPAECFDAKLIRQFSEIVDAFLKECPELRGVVVVLDFQGELNEVAKSGIWLTRSGTYGNPAEVLGAMDQTLRLLTKQMEKAVQLGGQIVKQIVDLHGQKLELEAYLKALAEQRDAQDQDSPGPSQVEAGPV